MSKTSIQKPLSGKFIISDSKSGNLEFTKDFEEFEFLSKASSQNLVKINTILGGSDETNNEFLTHIIPTKEEEAEKLLTKRVGITYSLCLKDNSEFIQFLNGDEKLLSGNAKVHYFLMKLCNTIFFIFDKHNEDDINDRKMELKIIFRKFNELRKILSNKNIQIVFIEKNLSQREYKSIRRMYPRHNNVRFLTPNENAGKTVMEYLNEHLIPQEINKDFFNVFSNFQYFSIPNQSKKMMKNLKSEYSAIKKVVFSNTKDRIRMEELVVSLKDLVRLNNLKGMNCENFVKVLGMKNKISTSIVDISSKLSSFEKIISEKQRDKSKRLNNELKRLDRQMVNTENLKEIKSKLEALEALMKKDEKLKMFELEIIKIRNRMDNLEHLFVTSKNLRGLKKKIIALQKKRNKQLKDTPKKNQIGKKEIPPSLSNSKDTSPINVNVEKFDVMEEEPEDNLNDNEIEDNLNDNEIEGENELKKSDILDEINEEEVVFDKIEKYFERKYRAKENDLKRKQEQVENDRKKVEEEKKKLEIKRNQMEEDQNRIQTSKKISDLESQIKSLQNDMNNLKKDVGGSVQEQLQQTKKNNDSIQKNQVDLTERIQQVQNDNDIIAKKIASVEKSYVQKKKQESNEVEVLKKKLDETKTEILTNLNKKLLREMNGRKRALKELNEKCRNSVNLNEVTSSDLEALRKQFVESKSKTKTIVHQTCKGIFQNNLDHFNETIAGKVMKNIEEQSKVFENRMKNKADLLYTSFDRQIKENLEDFETQRRTSKEEFDIVINEMINHVKDMEKFKVQQSSKNKLFEKNLLKEIDEILLNFKNRVIVGTFEKGISGRVNVIEKKFKTVHKFIEGLKRVGISGVGTNPSFKYTKSKYFIKNMTQDFKKSLMKELKREETLKSRRNNKSRSKLLNTSEDVIQTNMIENEEEKGEGKVSVLRMKDVMSTKEKLEEKRKKKLSEKKRREKMNDSTEEIEDENSNDNTLKLEEREGNEDVEVVQDDNDVPSVLLGDFDDNSLLEQVKKMNFDDEVEKRKDDLEEVIDL